MKKMLWALAATAAALVMCAHPGQAYQDVTSTPNGGCLNCHSFAGGAGAQHSLHTAAPNSLSCATCHAGGTPGKNVETSACIVCHPAGNAGQCSLVNLAAHPKSGAQNCLTCHASCAQPTSTTTSAPTGQCVDSDNDSYGDNCAAGPDCDDSDPAVHEGCVPDCTLKIRPAVFSSARALLQPVQFFVISADRDSDISFANPICIYWESEGIDDIVRLRIGEKKIVGFVQVYPNHLTAGNFSVQVTYGDLHETACGPIEVTGGAAAVLRAADAPVRAKKTCF